MHSRFRYSEGSLGVFRVTLRGRKRLNSFTLVEVVIAIGVTAFVLVSILGLMAYASQTVQQSDKYARLATIASQVLTTVESEQFSISPTVLGTSWTTNYSSEGLPTNAAGAYYQCTVVDATPTGTGFTLKDAGANPLMEPVQIIIRWPTPKYNNTNIIVTSILNYD